MKKICMTICGIVGVLACGTIVQGRTTETQNVNILLKESSICLESSDMKVGDYLCTYEYASCGSGHDLKVEIYESNGSCGNYYAIVYGEKYKVQIGQWHNCRTDYSYSFVYNGRRYLFNL